jgi:4-hydroxy-tetrahydrodipicolinate synthase
MAPTCLPAAGNGAIPDGDIYDKNHGPRDPGRLSRRVNERNMFNGVIPILPTPFHDDESLDLESWERLLQFMIGQGVDGVTILGVLGESNRLSDHEREQLIGRAVQAVDRRLPIIVGTSHTGTRAAAYLARMAQDLGADGVMVTPGKEPVPSDDRIVELFQAVAKGLRLPIVLQDHPGSTEVHLSIPLMVRIVRTVDAVECVKEEAVPTAAKIRLLRDALGDRAMPILTGLGALYAPFDLEAGSDGFNTGFAFPEALQAMVAAARLGDWLTVHELYARFAALIVFEQQPGVAIRKDIFRRRGLLTSSRVRHPGASISPAVARQVETLLARALPDIDITRPLGSESLRPATQSLG